MFGAQKSAGEIMMETVNITQRTGQFGPNRVREIQVGSHRFLLDVVGSGAIRLRASVTRDGRLSLPSERADWTIEITSTGGGKVTEALGGTHPAQGFEASLARHQGFALARITFWEVWGHYFDPESELINLAEDVAKQLRRRGDIPTPPKPER